MDQYLRKCDWSHYHVGRSHRHSTRPGKTLSQLKGNEQTAVTLQSHRGSVTWEDRLGSESRSTERWESRRTGDREVGGWEDVKAGGWEDVRAGGWEGRVSDSERRDIMITIGTNSEVQFRQRTDQPRCSLPHPLYLSSSSPCPPCVVHVFVLCHLASQPGWEEDNRAVHVPCYDVAGTPPSHSLQSYIQSCLRYQLSGYIQFWWQNGRLTDGFLCWIREDGYCLYMHVAIAPNAMLKDWATLDDSAHF